MKLYTKKIGAGKNIVLLHGWSFHSGIWSFVTDALSRYYHVILIDLPGFGETPFFFYTFDSLLDAIAAVVPEASVYVGWSLGGLLAMGMANKFPQQVTSMVTVGSTPYFIAEKDWPGVSEEAFQDFYSAIKFDVKSTLEKFCFSLCAPSERALYGALLYKIMMKKGCPSEAALLTGLTVLHQTDLRVSVKKLLCPQLHVIGSEDKMAPSILLKQYFSCIPRAKTQLMVEAGHVPFLTQPSQFMQCIFNFLGHDDAIFPGKK